MVSKDQGIGGAILAVCVIIALAFVVLVIFPAQVSQLLGMTVNELTGNNIRLDVVLILVSIAFIAILAIGAWIGWTMATTPPPKPIEEITTEIEEKKEEPKVEEPAKQAEMTATEDKTAAKKKK
jgi:predicted DNA-binding transcriptional regulator